MRVRGIVVRLAFVVAVGCASLAGRGSAAGAGPTAPAVEIALGGSGGTRGATGLVPAWPVNPDLWSPAEVEGSGTSGGTSGVAAMGGGTSGVGGTEGDPGASAIPGSGTDPNPEPDPDPAAVDTETGRWPWQTGSREILPARGLDLYDARGVRWQDPDYTACTAASTVSMLNLTVSRGDSTGMTWTISTSYRVQESVLAFERTHMTMLATSLGTDPHGWRNALNYLGWGSLDAGVYADRAYASFDEAAKATVEAIARYRRPVGILALAGSHSEIVTGYRVSGADPAESSAFTIDGIYLTDPYRANGHRDLYVSYQTWRSGGPWVRFAPYLEADSPYRDPIDGRVGRSEWYGRWVIIAPVK